MARSDAWASSPALHARQPDVLIQIGMTGWMLPDAGLAIPIVPAEQARIVERTPDSTERSSKALPGVECMGAPAPNLEPRLPGGGSTWQAPLKLAA